MSSCQCLTEQGREIAKWQTLISVKKGHDLERPEATEHIAF